MWSVLRPPSAFRTRFLRTARIAVVTSLTIASMPTVGLGQPATPDPAELRNEISSLRTAERDPLLTSSADRRRTGRSNLVQTTAASTRTVTVDCNKNQTIQKALETNADALIIEIEGLCVEDVEITRDRVTLLGQDPSLDGIRATAGSDDPRQSALHIRGARQVRVENLRFEGSSWNGVRISNSADGIDFANVIMADNGVRGLTLFDAAATFTDVTMSGNGDPTSGSGEGIYAFGSSILVCDNCTVLDNPGVGEGWALVVDQAEASFTNSSLGGFRGVRTAGTGQATLLDSSVDAVAHALIATESSKITAVSSATQGRILAAGTAHIELAGTHVGAEPSVAFDDAYIWVNAEVDGTLYLFDFARARVLSGADLGGVACFEAAQAACDVAAVVGSSTCGGCPAP